MNDAPDSLNTAGGLRADEATEQYAVGTETMLYTNTVARAALRWVAEYTLTIDPRSGHFSVLHRDSAQRIFTANGVAECGFLYYVYPIYACVMSWLLSEKYGDLTFNTETAGTEPEHAICTALTHDQWLQHLDCFTIGIATYLVEQLSRGRRGDTRFYSAVTGNDLCDPDIWDKLTAFLQLFFLEIRNALAHDRSEQSRTGPTPEPGDTEFKKVLHKYLLGDHPGDPCPDLASVPWATPDQKHAAGSPLRPPDYIVWAHGRVCGPFGADGAAFKEYEKFIKGEGWEHSESLRHSSEKRIQRDFSRLPRHRFVRRIIITGRRTVAQLQRTYKRLRRALGIHTNSIHVYSGQEYADLLPSFIFVLVAIGLLLVGKASAVRAVLASPIGITAILGIALSTTIGCCSTWRDMSQLGLARRRGFAAVSRHTVMGSLALAVAAIIYFVPTEGNVGIWFLKMTVAACAIAETWGYWAMGRSLAGLSFFYHFKAALPTARGIIAGLMVGQQLLLLGVGLTIGYLTYSWWRGHYIAALASPSLLCSDSHVLWCVWSRLLDEGAAYRHLFGAYLYLVITLYLIYGGLWFLLTGLLSLHKTVQEWLGRDSVENVLDVRNE